jgi:hypothetical protein
LRPELIVIMVSGSEMPVSAALTAVDAFIPKLEVIRELLPVIAELCGRGRGRRHKAGVRLEDRQRAS